MASRQHEAAWVPQRDAGERIWRASRGFGAQGSGHAISHHGELIQGALRIEGKTTPCLVSLPRPDKRSFCRLELFDDSRLEVSPSWKHKALRAARLALAHCGLPRATGRLTLRCEVEAGLGLGASTADVVAAIRAVAQATNSWISPEQVAAMAVEAEVACDPTMFEEPAMLFAPRQGRMLEYWGAWYPDFLVFGCNLRPDGDGIDTLSLSPDYSPAELKQSEQVVDAARLAFRRRDARAVAIAATQSAQLNQSRVRLERFEAWTKLAAEIGALGVQISHSGVVGGVLLDPSDAALSAKISVLQRACRSLGGGASELFRTGPAIRARQRRSARP